MVASYEIVTKFTGAKHVHEKKQVNYLRSVPISEVEELSGAEKLYCEPISDGAWNELPSKTCSTLRNNCDVVIRFGFGLIKGDVLGSTKHGVISTHGSDIREYRGMGPRITFLEDDQKAKVTLQKLTEDIDGGEVLAIESERLPPSPTLDDLYGAVYRLQTKIFATGIERLIRGEEPKQVDDLGDYHPHHRLETDPLFVGKIMLKNNFRRIQNVGLFK